MKSDVYKKLRSFQEMCEQVDKKSREGKERKPDVLKRLGVSAWSLRSWANGAVPSNASLKRLMPVFEAYLEADDRLPEEISQRLARIEALLEQLCDALLLDEPEENVSTPEASLQ